MKEVGLAAKAETVVAAYSTAAAGTAPFRFFFFKEAFHTGFPNGLQVFEHTQVIFRAVALVESFKAAAWKIGAFIAEPRAPFAER